jgi:hypothetical protein
MTKHVLACSVGLALLAIGTSQAQAEGPLDFHLFESSYARNDAVEAGYDQVRRAVPLGQSADEAVAALRRAGAHCQSARNGRAELSCFYREQVSVDDYVNTTATWDVDLTLADGKVAAINVARRVDQR